MTAPDLPIRQITEFKTPQGDFLPVVTDGNVAKKKASISLHDICYVQGFFGSRRVLSDCPRRDNFKDQCFPNCRICPEKALLWWDRQNIKYPSLIENNKNPPYLKDELIGFVKNSAWAHERETRLVLTVPEIVEDHIDIQIPQEILLNIQISIGPKSTLKVEHVKRMMAKYLLGSEDEHGNIQNVSYSYYNENYSGRRLPLLQIRRHCDKHLKNPGCFKNSFE